MHLHVVAVEPKPPFVVALTFADGSQGSVDAHVGSSPVKECSPPRGDPVVFNQVAVDPEVGTIVWPNGADLESRRVVRAGARGGGGIKEEESRLQPLLG